MSDRQPALLVYARLDRSRLPHLRRLHQLPYPVVLLDERDTVEDWAGPYVDHFLHVSRRDPAGAQEAVDRLCRENGLQVTGVLSLTETAMLFCSLLARHYGCRFASPQTLVHARDKGSMREMLDRHGIPSIPHRYCTDLIQALEFAHEAGYHVILKPLMTGGKVHTRRVDDPQEMTAHFHPCLHGGMDAVRGDPLWDQVYDGGANPRILVEKLLGGRTMFPTRLGLPVGEISVEGCVVDGHVHVLAFHDKPLADNGPYFEELVWSTPSRLPQDALTAVAARAEQVVRACQVDDSVFHVEFRTLDDATPAPRRHPP